MKTVILAGGMGTRLAEETITRPKPMVEIGGRPILWHLMNIYGNQGLCDFVIALGYKGEMIKKYFIDYYALHGDLSVDMGRGTHIVHPSGQPDWKIDLVDTGIPTQTGGRIKRLKKLIGGETFMATYADGLAKIDLKALLAFHRAHGKLATVTAVHPPSRFGKIIMEGEMVRQFSEKPAEGEGWINGGYYVFEPEVFDYIDGDAVALERQPMERLAKDCQLMAYRHEGFWQMMDNLQEKNLLEELWGIRKSPLGGMAVSNFWKDRPTFVTGATGLLGAWLVRRLVESGAEVTCLVRDHVPHAELFRSGISERVSLVHGDLLDQVCLERALSEYGIDTVIHLAAQAIVGVANRNPTGTFETNIRGTWNLLEACRRIPTVRQIVVASSDKAYGDHDVLPYEEHVALKGRHPYDVSKSCADLITHAYAHTYGVPAVITRCGNFYGGGDLNWNRIVPGTIRSLLRGERPIIRSDGHYIRDYLYVEDGAAAYMLLAEKLAVNRELIGEAFNFSVESQVSVLEIVERLRLIMGSSLEPDVRNEASNEIRNQYLSARKAREVLGWSPLFDLETGLRKTVDWYSDFLEQSPIRSRCP